QRDQLPGIGLLPGGEGRGGAAVAAPRHHRGSPAGCSCSSAVGGKRPSGVPLPSQLSRLTRPLLSPPPTSSSDFWRCWSMWKFSTATGVGALPEPSPKGPEDSSSWVS